MSVIDLYNEYLKQSSVSVPLSFGHDDGRTDEYDPAHGDYTDFHYYKMAHYDSHEDSHEDEWDYSIGDGQHYDGHGDEHDDESDD